MKKLLLLLICILSVPISFCQTTTIYTNDFEKTDVFNYGNGAGPNTWVVEACAGNGPSIPGTDAMYYSMGGATAGCGVDGTEQFAYDNAAAGTTQELIASEPIDAACASTLELTFDYLNNTGDANDYAEVVYSTDGGTTWNIVGGTIPTSATWTTMTVNLPVSLDFSSFDLGFRAYVNDNTIGDPFAVDNFVVSGLDTEAPTMTCSATGDLFVDINCDALVTDYSENIITLSDNCTDSASITFNYSPAIGTPTGASIGDIVDVQLTAVDEAGNTSSTCNISLTVVDSIAPVFDYCPSDTIAYTDENCEVVLEDYGAIVTFTDNCGSPVIISQTPNPGTVLSGSSVVQLVEVDVTDGYGNTRTCQFNVTLTDSILPTIECPTTQTLYADSGCQAELIDYTDMAVISDNCVDNSSMTVTQSPLVGAIISSDTLVTLTVSGGEPSTPQECTFTVNLIDTITPSITCPVVATEYADANCEYLVEDYTDNVIWSDNCTSMLTDMTVVQTPTSGSSVSSGTTSINIDFTDEDGNTGSCSTTITVLDTLNPTITCPSDQDINMDASCFATVPDFTSMATVDDNCTSIGTITINQSPIGNSINAPEVITLTAEDASGNLENCTFTVTPIDVTAPDIDCPTSPIEEGTTTACEYNLVDQSATIDATDNCSASTNLTYSYSPSLGTALPLGDNNVDVTVTDEAGNSSVCAFTITVIDDDAPTITTCPSAQTEYADADCNATLSDYTALLSASDNCDAALDVTQSPGLGTVISSATLVTLTATDDDGNSTDCNFTVNISDTIQPTVVCPENDTVAIDASCSYTLNDYTGLVTGTDNCSVLADMTVSQNPVAGSAESGVTAILFTLTDAQGNNQTCTMSVIPDDNETPTITCPPNEVVDNGTDCDYTLGSYTGLAVVTDNCANYSITQTPPNGSTISTGSNTIDLTVTDAGGNTASCSFTVTVEESVAPTITCPSDTQSCDPVMNYALPTFNDNCTAYIEQTDASGLSSGSTFPIGITAQEYTVYDSTGNSASCTFNVEILDYPSNATILEDTIAVCGANNVSIEAVENTSGTGEWSISYGQGTFNNEFSYQTGVNNLGDGENMFVWTVSSASCGSLSDSVLVINSEEPSAANVQDTVISCEESVVAISTATPASGTGIWTSIGNATFADASDNTTSVSNLNNGWNQIVWSVSTIGCPANSDTMNILYYGSVEIFTEDTTLCFEDQGAIYFSGSPAIGDQEANWSFMKGGGTIDFPTENATNISDFEIGENIVLYTLESAFCSTQSDTAVVVLNLCNSDEPEIPTVITPNADGHNDLFVIGHLEKVYPDLHITIFNRWGSVVFESTGYESKWDGTYNNEDLPMGTYFYKIELNDENNTVYNGPINIIH